MSSPAKVARVRTVKPTRTPGDRLTAPPAKVSAEECSKAHLILRYAHDTCNSMLTVFRQSLRTRGQERGSPRGAPTDEQMDLLRAMLVFAGAGLDSMLKQLIRNALPALSRVDEKVAEGFKTFATRRLRPSQPDGEDDTGHKLLAAAIISDSPRETILEAYVHDLIRGSLQSASELSRSTAALGFQGMLSTYGHLAEAFRVRNQIIHELDINFSHATRNRQTRALVDMVQLSDEILRVAAHILVLTDEQLAKPDGD